jgi:uncharacterized cupredoxin-like copper-binding protein
MRSLLFSLSLLALAAPASAAPDWRQAREYDVLLSSFDIQPQSIQLKAGQPVRLRLINNSSIAHSFSAGDFFSSGEVRPREKKLLSGGKIEVGPGNTREVLIVPKAGRYSARCANLFHRVMGMSASIVVE